LEKLAMSRYYPYFARNFVVPFYDLFRGTSRFKFEHILKRTQWLSQNQLELLQKKSLRTLINHAYETVPYYRRLFKKEGLKPSDIKDSDDLTKFPLLTKNDIRENFEDLISKDYPKNRLIRYRSGGTGNPISFFITKEQLSWELAAESRAYGWADYRLGDRCFMFWGSPIDKSKYQTMSGRFTKAIERLHVSDSYLMSKSTLAKFANSLKKFDPEIIKGYTTSVLMVAKYLLENNFDFVRPKSVLTTAETLFDSDRKIIEEAFGCPVFDCYGSREIGALAAECEEHSGYHITMENIVMEFVKEGEHVAPGEKGSIIITNLRNFGMPFIRYKIGDIGIPSKEKCNCGRGLSLLSSIEGRVADFLAVYDKEKDQIVSVGPVYPIFERATTHISLDSYQVIQEKVDEIVIKVVKGKGYSQKDTDFLLEYTQNLLGNNVTVRINFVDHIPPSPSGKRSRVISKVNSFF
jgi:phenylacetate-CoA ligase